MTDPMWSRTFARQIATTLGYRLADAPTAAGLLDLDPEAERTIEQVTEALRYLPAEQVQCALDFSEFLRAQISGSVGPAPSSYVPGKLREVCDLVLYLRERHGTKQPADESDDWTDEDRSDATIAALRRLNEDDPYPWEEPKDAQAG